MLADAGLPEPGDDALAFLDDGAVELGADHSVAGNPMRFTTGRVSPAARRPVAAGDARRPAPDRVGGHRTPAAALRLRRARPVSGDLGPETPSVTVIVATPRPARTAAPGPRLDPGPALRRRHRRARRVRPVRTRRRPGRRRQPPPGPRHPQHPPARAGRSPQHRHRRGPGASCWRSATTTTSGPPGRSRPRSSSCARIRRWSSSRPASSSRRTTAPRSGCSTASASPSPTCSAHGSWRPIPRATW